MAPKKHQLDMRVAEEYWDVEQADVGLWADKYVMIVRSKTTNPGTVAPMGAADTSGEYVVYYFAAYKDGEQLWEVDKRNIPNMKLNDCTKEELIFVIERLQLYNPSQEVFVLRALNDVATQREEKKLAQADQLADLSFRKHQEYIDLLVPYEGKRLVDIPASVLKRADDAMKEAQKADREWNRIVGFS